MHLERALKSFFQNLKMNKRIEGLFLKSTKIKQNSIIVDFITLNHGKASFVFKASKNKNISSLFQPFHFIDFSCKFNPDKKLNPTFKYIKFVRFPIDSGISPLS